MLGAKPLRFSFALLTLPKAILTQGSTASLPSNISIDDGIIKVTSYTSPSSSDIKFWILAAFGFILVRTLVERCIFQPWGQLLCIRDRVSPKSFDLQDNSSVKSLEKAYSSNTKWNNEDIKNLCEQTGLKFRDIERWLRKKHALAKPSKLQKFKETGWRLVSYLASVLLGIGALWDKSWFWDMQECWTDYPDQFIPDTIWWNYLYGAGLYGSFLITQAFDVRRSDFKEMFLHHVTTLGLIGSSWLLNMTRIGSIVLFLHDVGDVFLEATKLAKYANKMALAHVLFGIFAIAWTATRLVMYPKKILIEGTQSMMKVLPPLYSYPVFTMALALFCLHLFWSYFIAKVVVATFTSNTKNKRDTRSSTESSSESECSSHSAKEKVH